MNELKVLPCPECGAEVEIITNELSSWLPRTRMIKCVNYSYPHACLPPGTGYVGNEHWEEQVRRWNAMPRHTSADLVAAKAEGFAEAESFHAMQNERKVLKVHPDCSRTSVVGEVCPDCGKMVNYNDDLRAILAAKHEGRLEGAEAMVKEYQRILKEYPGIHLQTILNGMTASTSPVLPASVISKLELEKVTG